MLSAEDKKCRVKEDCPARIGGTGDLCKLSSARAIAQGAAVRTRVVVSGLVGVALGAAAVWLSVRVCQSQATTVLLVRHAEREPGKDELSAAGLKRSASLAQSLRAVELRAIYQTQYRRTQQGRANDPGPRRGRVRKAACRAILRVVLLEAGEAGGAAVLTCQNVSAKLYIIYIMHI